MYQNKNQPTKYVVRFDAYGGAERIIASLQHNKNKNHKQEKEEIVPIIIE